jgi:O-antigen ligase
MAVGLILALYLGTVYASNLVLSAGVFFLIGITLAGSRGVLLALLLTAASSAIALWATRGSLTRRQVKLGVTFSAVWASFFVGFQLVAWLDAPVRVVERFAKYGVTYGSGREDIYPLAWRVFLEHPFFGVGLNGFRDVYDNAFPGSQPVGETYAHNIVLSTLAEGGLIGAILLV